MIHAIPVEFGPHVADWWMLGATISSVIVSAVIAGVAVWSGIKSNETAEAAREIASDSRSIAADSLKHAEESVRRQEDRIARDARAEVSLAMFKVLVAIDKYAYAPPPGPERGRLWDEIRSTLDDSLARLDVYVSLYGEPHIRPWFYDSVDNIVVYADTKAGQSLILHASQSVRQSVSKWNVRGLSADDLEVVTIDESWLTTQP